MDLSATQPAWPIRNTIAIGWAQNREKKMKHRCWKGILNFSSGIQHWRSGFLLQLCLQRRLCHDAPRWWEIVKNQVRRQDRIRILSIFKRSAALLSSQLRIRQTCVLHIWIGLIKISDEIRCGEKKGKSAQMSQSRHQSVVGLTSYCTRGLRIVFWWFSYRIAMFLFCTGSVPFCDQWTIICMEQII